MLQTLNDLGFVAAHQISVAKLTTVIASLWNAKVSYDYTYVYELLARKSRMDWRFFDKYKGEEDYASNSYGTVSWQQITY